MIKREYYRWSPLLLRIVIGYGFMSHGWAKLSRGPANFEKLLTQLGVPFAHFTSWLVPLTELLGGLAILAGVFAGIAAIPLIFTMLVAMFSVHMKYGFSSVKTIGLTEQGPVLGPPGYEISLLYIAGLISLILSGAGIFSIDSMVNNRKMATKPPLQL